MQSFGRRSLGTPGLGWSCVPGVPHHCLSRVGATGGPLGLGYAGTRLELDRARPATAHPGCAHPSSPGLWPRAGILPKSDPARGRMPLGVPGSAGAAWDEAPCHVRACPVDPERRPGPLSVLARALPYPLRGPPLHPTGPLLTLCPNPTTPSSPLHALIGGASAGWGASLIGDEGPELRECGCVVRLPGPYCRARELDPSPAPMPPDNSVSVNGAGHPI